MHTSSLKCQKPRRGSKATILHEFPAVFSKAGSWTNALSGPRRDYSHKAMVGATLMRGGIELRSSVSWRRGQLTNATLRQKCEHRLWGDKVEFEHSRDHHGMKTTLISYRRLA